ncbi:hypothetical protein PF003_g29256 [Phytophthora fragariae]|nr:hypothetical protein PF003_g29256 [Phytophthora fragariae]
MRRQCAEQLSDLETVGAIGGARGPATSGRGRGCRCLKESTLPPPRG